MEAFVVVWNSPKVFLKKWEEVHFNRLFASSLRFEQKITEKSLSYISTYHLPYVHNTEYHLPSSFHVVHNEI